MEGKRMYDNVGQKMMGIARVSGIISRLCGFVVGAVAIFTSEEYGVLFFFVCVGLGYAGYVSTWLLYGIGNLIDNVNAIRKKLDSKEDYDDALPSL